MPLGAGALAGVNFATDRGAVAARAGLRRGRRPTRIDAVANRDFVLDYLAAAATTCATHLSRLGAELVLWSSAGVRLRRALRRVDDAARRSCPRRRTPTPPSCCAPRRRGSSAHLTALHGVMHGAAADLQQGPAGGQGAPLRRRRHARADARGRDGHDRRGALRPRAPWRGAAADELIAATDLADLLVHRGMPFREAHGVVAGLVRDAVDAASAAAGRGVARLARARRRVLRACCRSRSWLESKVSEGGTSLAARARAARAPRARQLVKARVLRPPRPRRSPATSSAAWCATATPPGVIVETEAYHDTEPACHAYVGLTAAHLDALRAARHGLRLPLLRHPRAAERRLRARGRRRGGADPRARAARRARR